MNLNDLLCELESQLGSIEPSESKKRDIRVDIAFIPGTLETNGIPAHYKAYTPDIPEFYRNVGRFPEVCSLSPLGAFGGFLDLIKSVKYPFRKIVLTREAQSRIGLANLAGLSEFFSINEIEGGK